MLINFNLIDLQIGTIFGTSLIGILTCVGVVYAFRLRSQWKISLNQKKKSKESSPLVISEMKKDQEPLAADEKLSDFPDLQMEECPFISMLRDRNSNDFNVVSNHNQNMIRENNHENTISVELTPEEKVQEEIHRNSQLEKIFQLVKEQEKICHLLHEQDASMQSKNAENIYEKFPKYEIKNDDDGFRFSLLNHESLTYSPMKENEFESEVQNTFTSQLKLYGFK